MKTLFSLVLLALFSLTAAAQTYSDIQVSQLPKAAREYIAQNRPDSKIVRAVLIDDQGVQKYGAVTDTYGKKHALIFDKEGRFLEEADQLLKNRKQGKPRVQAKPGPSQSSGTPAQTPKEPTGTGEVKTKPPAPSSESTPGQAKTPPAGTPPAGETTQPGKIKAPPASAQQPGQETKPGKVTAPPVTPKPTEEAVRPEKTETTATPVNPAGTGQKLLVKLPKKAANYVRSAYPNGTVTDAMTFTRDKSKYYQVTVQDGNLIRQVIFSKRGKYVSSRTNTVQEK